MLSLSAANLEAVVDEGPAEIVHIHALITIFVQSAEDLLQPLYTEAALLEHTVSQLSYEVLRTHTLQLFDGLIEFRAWRGFDQPLVL